MRCSIQNSTRGKFRRRDPADFPRFFHVLFNNVAFVLVYYFMLSIDSKIFTISENYTINRRQGKSHYMITFRIKLKDCLIGDLFPPPVVHTGHSFGQLTKEKITLLYAIFSEDDFLVD